MFKNLAIYELRSFIPVLGACILTVLTSSVYSQHPVGPPHSPSKGVVPPSVKKSDTPKHSFHPLPKRTLPPMEKPFGMPGVVGLKEGKWEGTDYLGHVANAMSVSVEIIKGENYEGPVIDETAINSLVLDLLKNSSISTLADVKEGPPLPFLHLLLLIYPVDTDKILIYGSVRLFESVQVMRKNFAPAGYWQAITWESQDMTLAAKSQLMDETKTLAESLVKGFLNRYKLYNRVTDPALPSSPQVS